MLKLHAGAILSALLITGCSTSVPQHETSADLFDLLELPGSSGVIAPPAYARQEWVDGRFYGKPIDGFWLATPQDVRHAHARARIDIEDAHSFMQRGLVHRPDHRSALEDVEFIIDHFDTFDSQYLGFVLQGRRRVMCNFFIDEGARNEDLWRREWISVDGGGAAYWTIEYDVDEDRCHDFWPSASM